VVGGTVGGTLGGTLGGTGSGVVPFGEGMTRPSPISPEEFRYTREAMEAKVSGLMIVKCTVTTEGTLQDCKIIKGVPLMDQAVLAALAKHRGTPITFQGKPVSVSYTFNIRLKMPE
jgi:periplasmic protein TonB